MATQFQNRLVGTVILVAVGVILFPEILDGDKDRREQVFASIPLRPASMAANPKADVPSQADVELTVVQLPEEVEQQQIVLEAQQNNNIPATSSSLEQEGEGSASAFSSSAWVVQLGIFRNAQSVETLVTKLRQAGFQAHSEPKIPVQGNLNRVFIGPALSKKKLESQLPALYKLTELKGRVLPFKALKPGA